MLNQTELPKPKFAPGDLIRVKNKPPAKGMAYRCGWEPMNPIRKGAIGLVTKIDTIDKKCITYKIYFLDNTSGDFAEDELVFIS